MLHIGMGERSRGIIARPDGSPGKRIANGFKASVKSRRKYRVAKGLGQERTIFEFIDEGGRLELFNKMRAIYDHPPVTRSAMKSIIEKLESNGGDASDINFMLMRFYSESLDIPMGLFVLFSHCVSIEADADSKEDVKDVLVRFRSAIDCLIEIKKNRGDTAFHLPLDRPSEYEAQITTLYQAAERYKSTPGNSGMNASSPQNLAR